MIGKDRSWVKREKRILKVNGISPHPFSGAKEEKPEDGSSELLVVQLKSTAKKSISVSLAAWNDVVREAQRNHKTPALYLEISGVVFVCCLPQDIPVLYEHVKELEEKPKMFSPTEEKPLDEEISNILDI